MKTVAAVGWPLGLCLIMAGLIWLLVEDNVRFGSGRKVSAVGPWLAAAGVLVLVVMLFIPASYDPI